MIDDVVNGNRVIKIDISDVAKYFAEEAGNITSGCRTIAEISGNWRPIDKLAQECLEWFKFVNTEVMRKEARKLGFKPNF